MKVAVHEREKKRIANVRFNRTALRAVRKELL